jgi:thiol-disulfide isomerase/thioredoxin
MKTFRSLRLALVGALVLVAMPGSRGAAQEVGLELGTTGPAAKLETLEGKPADLAEFVGKTPVVMEFWATWCGNCHELEPSLKALHAKYGAKVAFIGVAVSVNQSPARVKAYVAKNKLPWIQLFDRQGEASGAYDAPATSYIVILDREGKVIYTGVGGKQSLEPAIRKAIGG